MSLQRLIERRLRTREVTTRLVIEILLDTYTNISAAMSVIFDSSNHTYIVRTAFCKSRDTLTKVLMRLEHTAQMTIADLVQSNVFHRSWCDQEGIHYYVRMMSIEPHFFSHKNVVALRKLNFKTIKCHIHVNRLGMIAAVVLLAKGSMKQGRGCNIKPLCAYLIPFSASKIRFLHNAV